MQPRLSKILVYTMLALLAAFLFFWLNQEYKSEQSALRNERDLKIAKELFNVGGLDLNDLLTGIRGSETQIAVKLGMDSEQYETKLTDMRDSFSQMRSKMKIIYRENFSDTLIHKIDSIQAAIKNGVDTNVESDISITYSSIGKSEHEGMDSLDQIAISEFHHIIEKATAYDPAEIRKSALKKIWPQILFAFFLFTLMTYGIHLLQKSYKEQQLLLENKNNLISNITHELKTPVATISVALEAIQDFDVKRNPEKANSYIDLSRKELDRLSTSIDKVLQLSKMDAKNEVYHFEHQALLPLCTEVANNLDLQIKKKNVQLNINANKSGLMAKLDASHFKSMLFNLIDNSLKYGKEGGQINLNLEEKGKEIVLSVSDDGIGIGEQYISKLFDRFFRVPHGDQHNVKGYGLGLSYVKEIVDAHKWKIDVSSKENSGTTIRIKIPATHV